MPRFGKLCCWQKKEELQWEEKVMNSLLKMLKKRGGDYISMRNAIFHRNPNTKCVIMPILSKHKLKKCYKNDLPHVTYCRIWRWPDLQSHHELSSIETCQNPFSSIINYVCINPYHYSRVETFVKFPTLIPVPSPDPDISINITVEETHYPLKSIYSLLNYSSLSSESVSSESLSVIGHITKTMETNNYHNTLTASINYMSTPVTSINCMSTPVTTINYMSTPVTKITCMSTPVNTINSISTPVATPQTCVDNCKKTDFWCNIAYYEYDKQVGEKFRACTQCVRVDGLTDPFSSNRFCLGLLTNFNRSIATENTRRSIGRGLRLFYEDGEVYAQCLSDRPIFIKSTTYTRRHAVPSVIGRPIPSGCFLKLFDNNDFRELLTLNSHLSFAAMYELRHKCIIQISFDKEWRDDYMSVPCWVEIQINSGLKLLDEFLSKISSNRKKETII